MAGDWNKEDYGASLTSRCWTCTPYDSDWEGIQNRSGVKEIFEEELALGSVPVWAAEVVERMIGPLPPCGHYLFPAPLRQICAAIAEEKCPGFVLGCFIADSRRKRLLSYYVYCLDAWMKNAPLAAASSELSGRDNLGKDWSRILASVYETLGSHTEKKELLTLLLVHRLRWWIKSCIWADDKRDKFLLDVYSGDLRGNTEKEGKWGKYGNFPMGDAYAADQEVPEVKQLKTRIMETIPDVNQTLVRIESTWLCAPKVFRYLEKVISEIGSIDSTNGDTTGSDEGILQCEDTYPDFTSCKKWYSTFKTSLASWLEGDCEALPELGAMTPVKHWLVRILLKKLELYEQWNFGKLVGTQPQGKRGAKDVSCL